MLGIPGKELKALIVKAEATLTGVDAVLLEAVQLLAEARSELKAAKALRERLQKAVGGE